MRGMWFVGNGMSRGNVDIDFEEAISRCAEEGEYIAVSEK